MISTAWARLSEAKAGLTGKVTMRSARPTSSLVRPQRSRPNITAAVSPAASRRRHLGGGLGRADHRLCLVMGARGGGKHEAAIGERRLDAVEQLGAVEHAHRHRKRRAAHARWARRRAAARGAAGSRPKFAMARAAVPMFSPSCGSTSTITGDAMAVHSLVWSVPAPGMAFWGSLVKAVRSATVQMI